MSENIIEKNKSILNDLKDYSSFAQKGINQKLIPFYIKELSSYLLEIKKQTSNLSSAERYLVGTQLTYFEKMINDKDFKSIEENLNIILKNI